MLLKNKHKEHYVNNQNKILNKAIMWIKFFYSQIRGYQKNLTEKINLFVDNDDRDKRLNEIITVLKKNYLYIESEKNGEYHYDVFEHNKVKQNESDSAEVVDLTKRIGKQKVVDIVEENQPKNQPRITFIKKLDKQYDGLGCQLIRPSRYDARKIIKENHLRFLFKIQEEDNKIVFSKLTEEEICLIEKLIENIRNGDILLQKRNE